MEGKCWWKRIYHTHYHKYNFLFGAWLFSCVITLSIYLIREIHSKCRIRVHFVLFFLSECFWCIHEAFQMESEGWNKEKNYSQLHSHLNYFHLFLINFILFNLSFIFCVDSYAIIGKLTNTNEKYMINRMMMMRCIWLMQNHRLK